MRKKSSWLSRLCAFVLAVAFVVAATGCSQSTCCGKCDGQSPACNVSQGHKTCSKQCKKECKKSSKPCPGAAAKEAAKVAGETE